MPNLFDSLKIKDISLRNRIGVSPMCQYSSEDGHATDWHLVHLGSRAIGGAALVIVEATAVDPYGRISPQDAGLWQDSQIEPLSRINKFIKSHGSVSGIQLAHAGRKASAARPWEGGQHLNANQGGWNIIAPSANAFGDTLDKVPAQVSKDDIKAVTEAFRTATKRALTAGFEWLEFHSAHGYLSHSFLSPLSNFRTDEYGGTLVNRMRFALETVSAMRAEWPERLPFSVRLSCTDWDEAGWTLDDSVILASELKKLGVDLIDCSSGFVNPGIKNYPFGTSWQVPLSDRIRNEVGILTAAVGLITSPPQADEIIRNGRADIVLLAREMLKDPYWPYRAAKTLGKECKLPVQYENWL